ncbi:MAG: hypothetical protein AAF986_09400 [Pseudomonadota bacterium]
MFGFVLSFLGAVTMLDAPSEGALSYDACIAAVEADASVGRDYAEKWDALGGGKAAKHCAAVAALAVGSPLSAGAMLVDLAKDELDPGAAARLYLQGAEAFMDGAARAQAFKAVHDAYKVVPDAPDLHMAAATIYATGEEWEGVVLALTALSKHADLSADAYALRARAFFEQENYDAAASDVALALSMDPLLVDGLVLRGKLTEKGVVVPGRFMTTPETQVRP